MMKSRAQVEQESEQARANFAETLEELRIRATPGHVVDEVVDYVRDTQGGMFFRNLQQQIVDNPLPVTLVGAGIAWLMIQNARSGRREHTALRPAADDGEGIGQRASDAAVTARGLADRLASAARHGAETTGSKSRELSERVGSATSSVGDKVRDKVRDAADRASETASNVRDAAASSFDKAREKTVSAYGAATDAIQKARKSSSKFGRNMVDSGQSVVDFCKEQPLILGGLGLAIGAALGAALPRSETEDRLMGEASDDAKEAARRLAAKTADSAKHAYGEVSASARDLASGEGARMSTQRETRRSASASVAQESTAAGNKPMEDSATTNVAASSRQRTDDPSDANCSPSSPSDGSGKQ